MDSWQGRAKIIAEKITQLDFRRADASVPADEAMILKAIEDLDGGLERVEWTVKHLVTDFASFLYASAMMELELGVFLLRPSGGASHHRGAFELESAGWRCSALLSVIILSCCEDMLPCRICHRGWSRFLLREVLSLSEISLRLQRGALFVLEGPGGSGKSVASKAVAKHAMAHGVLSLRVPVSQLAKVSEEQGHEEEDLLLLWGRERFGEAAEKVLKRPKERIILILVPRKRVRFNDIPWISA